MDPARALPAVVVVTVLAVSALLGSGAAGYPPGEEPPGSGNATVEVVSTPETVRLERARFGAGTFRLSAPPAVVRVHDVRGNPELTYAIDVPGLDFSEVAHYPLSGWSGRQTVAFDPVELSPQVVGRDRYEARVAVWLRSGDRYTQLTQTRVTLEVDHE